MMQIETIAIVTVPIFVLLQIMLIHGLLYNLINKTKLNLLFGLKLYLTSFIAGIISYVIDWYVIPGWLHETFDEGTMIGMGTFLYFSWLVVPTIYLIGVSILYLVKKLRKGKG